MGSKRITYSVHISSSTLYIYPLYNSSHPMKIIYQTRIHKTNLLESNLRFRELIHTIVFGVPRNA